MNIALWILQGLIALLMLPSGFMKATGKTEFLRERMPFLPAPIMRTLGVLEVLGAVALILPGILGLYTPLMTLAGTAFILVLSGASGLHVARGEQKEAAMTAIFSLLAVAIVGGRIFLAPF